MACLCDEWPRTKVRGGVLVRRAPVGRDLGSIDLPALTLDPTKGLRHNPTGSFAVAGSRKEINIINYAGRGHLFGKAHQNLIESKITKVYWNF